jgi:hypothetical protein
MSKKLNIQAVNAAHQAAADANTKANEVREALIARLRFDRRLSNPLDHMIGGILYTTTGEAAPGVAVVESEFRDQLEPTANSYGYTLADHPTRRDLVVVQPLEN